MRTAAVLVVFMPWILFAAALITGPIIEIPTDAMVSLMTLVWAMLSPFVIAGALLVAYREGQWSKKQ